MANISSVTNYFSKAQEGFSTTFAATASPGVATVTLTSTAGYSNGDTVVLIAEPTSTTNKQVFTGQVTPNGVITGVVWVTGTNTTHIAGAQVVDYPTASGFDMLSTGVQAHANQNGSLKTAAVQTAIGTGGIVFANLLATIFSGQLQSYTNTGTAGGTFYYLNLGGVKMLWGTTPAQTTAGSFANTSSYGVNFPSGFFSTVQSCNWSSVNPQGAAGQFIVGTLPTTTGVSGFWMQNGTVSGATVQGSLLVIGT